MNRLAKILGAAAVVPALIAVGFGLGRNVVLSTPAAEVPLTATISETGTKIENVITLNDEKLKSAALQSAVVQTRSIATTRLVPARLQYDDTRHIALKVLTDGVLTQMLVKTGDVVQAGQSLAEISSPEIGTARANLLQRDAERRLAEEKRAWAKASCDNLRRLIAAIKERQPFDEIERTFAKQNLGNHREQLLAAYTKFGLAESLSASIQSVGESGALPSKTVRERLSERQAARASLDGICEQVAFETQVECQQAEATAADAERRYEISRQHLHALIGQTEAKSKSSGSQSLADDTEDMTTEMSAISLMSVRAPFAGTIERRSFSANERVKQGDELFILADTKTLWVTADIRERDWRALALKPGQELTVSIPAIPDTTFSAALHYLGREVSTDSNAVPLVAIVENVRGLLRPGLFAHVALPLTEQREALAIPAESVVEHEGRKFAFLIETASRFRRVDLEVGEGDDEWVEIRKGLKSGDKVVSHGAFLLKSELLLEAEE